MQTRYKPKIYSKHKQRRCRRQTISNGRTKEKYQQNSLINDLKNAMKRKWIAQSPNGAQNKKPTTKNIKPSEKEGKKTWKRRRISLIQSIVSQLQKMKLHETCVVLVFLAIEQQQQQCSTHTTVNYDAMDD